MIRVLVGCHQGVCLCKISGLNLDEPGVCESSRLKDIVVVKNLFVYFCYGSGYRRVDVRDGFYGFDDGKGIVGGYRVADSGQFDENNIAKLFNRIIGKADFDDVCDSNPLVSLSVFQVLRYHDCSLLKMKFCRNVSVVPCNIAFYYFDVQHFPTDIGLQHSVVVYAKIYVCKCDSSHCMFAWIIS